jgi:hypothetical protein
MSLLLSIVGPNQAALRDECPRSDASARLRPGYNEEEELAT